MTFGILVMYIQNFICGKHFFLVVYFFILCDMSSVKQINLWVANSTFVILPIVFIFIPTLARYLLIVYDFYASVICP